LGHVLFLGWFVVIPIFQDYMAFDYVFVKSAKLLGILFIGEFSL